MSDALLSPASCDPYLRGKHMCLECALVQVHLVHVLEHMVLTLIDPKLVRMLPNRLGSVCQLPCARWLAPV